ncbi:MAG: hypothetical protein ACKO00_01700 [Crocinitomicaceae bacterium]
MKLFFTLLLFTIVTIPTLFSQKNRSFSGVLTYTIESVNSKDSVRSKIIIYAKDSLIRVVNFNSETGKQELIKHLTYNKSYLLIETPLQNFAIRTNEHLIKDSVTYTYQKKSGSMKIGGVKSKKF